MANLAVMIGVGDGSDTTPIATLDYATTTNGIAVYLDGVRQLAGTDFNVTAQTTLTFTTAPANSVGIDVYFLGLELSIPTPADATVTAAKLASNAVTTAKIIANAVDETKLKDALIADFTEVTVAAGDSILLGDATDCGNTKRDTVQGILDLAGAGFVLISKITSAATAWDFDDLDFTTYSQFVFYFEAVYPSTTGSIMEVLQSDDGGSSYHNSYRYANGGGYQYGASVDTGSASDTVIAITANAVQEAAHAGMVGHLTLHARASTANIGMTWNTGYKDDTSTDWEAVVGSGAQDTAGSDSGGWNSIRFQNSAGTNLNGAIYCYGVKRT